MKPQIIVDAFEHELNAAAADMQAEFFRKGAEIKSKQAHHHRTLARRIGARSRTKNSPLPAHRQAAAK